MITKTRIIATTISCFFFIFLSIASGDSIKDTTGPDIDKEQEIKNYIVGKWSTSYYELGTMWYYRFEITENKVKYWKRFGEWEWKTEPEALLSYRLSNIERDVYGAKYRNLSMTEWPLAIRAGGGLLYENGCIIFNNNCLKKGWAE